MRYGGASARDTAEAIACAHRDTRPALIGLTQATDDALREGLLLVPLYCTSGPASRPSWAFAEWKAIMYCASWLGLARCDCFGCTHEARDLRRSRFTEPGNEDARRRELGYLAVSDRVA